MVIGKFAANDILEFALAFMNAAPALIEAGANVQSLFQGTSESLKKMQDEKRGPSDTEWNAMNTMIRTLREELHKPDEA